MKKLISWTNNKTNYNRKATILSEQNKTVFKVHSKANKKNIKKLKNI